MKTLSYIFNLPWWVGLLLFFIGNAVTPLEGLVGVTLGSAICLFGCWTFANLWKGFRTISSPENLCFIPLVILSAYFIDMRFVDFYNTHLEYYIDPLKYSDLYVIRSAIGLWSGLAAFKYVR